MAEQILWVTDRCAREDLGLSSWPEPEGVAGVRNEIVRKFRERRATEPEPGTAYINDLSGVLKRPCYELKDERLRGATWFDRDSGVVYLLAVAQHESGKRTDAYARFVELAQSGVIMPTEEDENAVELFRAGRWLRALRDKVGPELRAAAMREPGVPLSRDIGACEVTLVMDRYDDGWYAQLRIDRSAAGGPTVSEDQAIAIAMRIFGAARDVDRTSTWYGSVVPWPVKVFEALL